MQPNVIVLVLDAARRDALEPYGAPAGGTPVIADLARRGGAHDGVYSAACWTAPSHGAMFTGRMPRALGLAGVPGGRPKSVGRQLEPERDRMLPLVLRRAGYRTGVFSANLWVSEEAGFATGVDRFCQVDSQRQAQLADDSLRGRASFWREAIRSRVDDGAAELGREIAPFVSEGSDPFFCFVNLIECHSPYLPPKPFAARSVASRLRAAEDARALYRLEAIWRICLGGQEVPDEVYERLMVHYRASVSSMDRWLGELCERLDEAGKLDETLIVVTSDHGENFGEGGLIAHGLSLDNRLINVPFVSAGPGSGVAPPSSLAGLPAYLAEATGLRDAPWSRDELPEGVGVAQLDPAADPADPRVREAVIDAWGLGEAELERFLSRLTCAVSSRDKLLRRGERPELWIDLEADPLELDPRPLTEVPPDRAAEVERLQAALRHPSVTAEREFELDEGDTGADRSEAEDLEERMRQLGYL